MRWWKVCVFLLILSTIFSLGLCVFAEEQAAPSETVAELIAVCEKLPDVKTVSIVDKEIVLRAKTLYDQLERTEISQVGAENLAKISAVYDAFIPFLLQDVSTEIGQLSDNPGKSDTEKVIALYENYQLLSDDAKESLNIELKSKLVKAVSRLAPEKLSETDQAFLGENETEENTKSSDGSILGMKVWEFVILAVLALVILLNIVIIIMVGIKVFLGKK